MRSDTRFVLVAVLCVSILAAVPVAVSPTRGWPLTLAVALAGASGVAVFLRRRYVAPLEELSGTVDVHTDAPLSGAELLRIVTSEYRAATTELASLADADHRRKAALAHASDGVVVVDPAGLVEYANPVARWLVHDRVLEATRRIMQPELEDLVSRAIADGQPVTADVIVRLPEPRNVTARAVPLPDGSCVLLFTDRTESERLDRMRRDFVANVSHELKTPVAGVRALAEVARTALDDTDPEAAGRFVARLQLEAERLAGLVADLLDLSRVEASFDLEREQVDVRSLLDAAAERVRAVAEAKDVGIDIAGVPTTVDADPAQLAMAVQNLVDNAVRYSDTGTIRLGVERHDGWVDVTIADQGIGIPTDELPRIFERFYRVDRARSRATGGTGLGLSIVRHVAENHGGRVEVTSDLGLGSTFTLRLPASAVAGRTERERVAR